VSKSSPLEQALQERILVIDARWAQ